jgi:Cu(I)/Ag(I) efflux system membrane fusion protein
MSDPELKNAVPSGPEPETPKRASHGRFRGALIVKIVVGVAIFIFGYAIAPRHPAGPHRASSAEAKEDASGRHIRYWTCSMHPQIRQPKKGKCPICFMDLIPVYETTRGGLTEGPSLILSKAARELAEIETSPVEYRPLSTTVRMVGKVEYDETRLAQVSAWIPGRIDKLYVNYVGVRVSKGEHLTYVYSPELRTAQEEFLIALRRWQSATRGGDPAEIASALSIKEAAQKKLELWGILPSQIQELEEKGKTTDHMTIYAPIGGTVIAREAFEGKYVQAGERLFTIAGLSVVWAMLDAYEIDLAWLRYGQTVKFETDVFPGETFEGRLAFIQPVLDEMTRTVKVRVNVPNADGRLKPGMFVRARVEVVLDEAGRVREPQLAGKWICPMHPEVVKDSAGACDVCGMDLVEAASLGFGGPEVPIKMVLSIPATAPLLTGTRAVVYVEERTGEEVSYVGREVKLGPRAGDYYLVRSGLREGERVVTRGNFKIDASLQIQAKPSMMKPEEGGPPPVHQHGGQPTGAPSSPTAPTVSRLSPIPGMQAVLEAYVSLAEALASDDASGAAATIASLKQGLSTLDGEELTGEAHQRFAELLGSLRQAIASDTQPDIDTQRKFLGTVTGPLGDYLRSFGHGFDFSLFEFFCPMAFGGKGAVWVQKGRDVHNPYFGKEMLECGELRQEFKPVRQGSD